MFKEQRIRLPASLLQPSRRWWVKGSTLTMGYQFFRKNVYARRGAHKWRSKKRNPSLCDIRDEMVRAPHACSHVAEPREPRVLFGRSPIEAFALASARADQAVD